MNVHHIPLLSEAKEKEFLSLIKYDPSLNTPTDQEFAITQFLASLEHAFTQKQGEILNAIHYWISHNITIILKPIEEMSIPGQQAFYEGYDLNTDGTIGNNITFAILRGTTTFSSAGEIAAISLLHNLLHESHHAYVANENLKNGIWERNFEYGKRFFPYICNAPQQLTCNKFSDFFDTSVGTHLTALNEPNPTLQQQLILDHCNTVTDTGRAIAGLVPLDSGSLKTLSLKGIISKNSDQNYILEKPYLVKAAWETGYHTITDILNTKKGPYIVLEALPPQSGTYVIPSYTKVLLNEPGVIDGQLFKLPTPQSISLFPYINMTAGNITHFNCTTNTEYKIKVCDAIVFFNATVVTPCVYSTTAFLRSAIDMRKIYDPQRMYAITICEIDAFAHGFDLGHLIQIPENATKCIGEDCKTSSISPAELTTAPMNSFISTSNSTFFSTQQNKYSEKNTISDTAATDFSTIYECGGSFTFAFVQSLLRKVACDKFSPATAEEIDGVITISLALAFSANPVIPIGLYTTGKIIQHSNWLPEWIRSHANFLITELTVASSFYNSGSMLKNGLHFMSSVAGSWLGGFWSYRTEQTQQTTDKNNKIAYSP